MKNPGILAVVKGLKVALIRRRHLVPELDDKRSPS
jgi:hypothetical protein